MNQTGINWCDRTWNPMTGCLHGCTYCYARTVAETRTKAFPQGFKPVFHEKRLDLPGKEKKPQTVFVGSMTDMMGDWWDNHDINAVIEACYLEKHHTFLWLTKMPQRYADFVWPDNCWLGTTITAQADADWRIPALLLTPEVKRFLSIEPMLGPVDLSNCRSGRCNIFETCRGARTPCDVRYRDMRRIHHVIVGGETGKDARPMHPDWVRSIRDQCEAAGVPFFLKSSGEWLPYDGPPSKWPKGVLRHTFDDGQDMMRVGKKKSGRLFDGREHNDLAWRI